MNSCNSKFYNIACRALFLLGCLFSAVLTASAQTAPADVIRRTFEELKNKLPEMSSPGTAAISVVPYPAFWLCGDGVTTLTIDRYGNISYKRTHGWANQSAINLLEQTNALKPAMDETANDAKLVERTRRLAKIWLTLDQASSFKPVIHHEILLLARLPDGQINKSSGRIIIRLYGPEQYLGSGYFQAVFDPDDRLLRVDLGRFDNSQGKSLAKEVFPKDMPLPPPYKMVGAKPLTLGCFFNPAESRFECNAFDTEGEPFFDLQTTANPFGRDHYDVSNLFRVSVPLYHQSKDYYFWAWEEWQRCGEVGTFRGNWIVRNGVGSWENSNQVLFHRSFASYSLVQGLPTKTRVFDKDGPLDSPKKYPWGWDLDYTQTFYDDLEKCNVAFFFSHGGGKRFGLQQQLDVWVNFMPQTEDLGEGNLRHIFLASCAGATYLREPEGANLLDTYIREAKVNGLRTVCAFDGGASYGVIGWRFFSHYNKFETVSDSWVFGMLDESPIHFPVTVSYGETPDEAVDTLLHGRFSDERAGAKYVVISDWTTDSKK